MAAFNFPGSPSLNQEYTANGRTYIFNGYAWDIKPVAGGGGGGGGIADAPVDGNTYARKDADWLQIVIPTIVNPANFSCVVANTNVQSIPANAVTLVTNMDTVDHDPAGAWDITSSSFICKRAGLYSIDCKAVISTLDAGARLVVFVYKNGLNYAMMGRGVAGAGGQMAGFGGGLLIPMVINDALDMRVFHANAAATDLVGVGGSETRYTTFAATFIG